MIKCYRTIRTFWKANFFHKFFLKIGSQIRNYPILFFIVLIRHLGPVCF